MLLSSLLCKEPQYKKTKGELRTPCLLLGQTRTSDTGQGSANRHAAQGAGLLGWAGEERASLVVPSASPRIGEGTPA